MVLTEIYDLLYRLGITANYTGFFHMGYAVKLCCERPERLLMVTKWVYPEVAKHYQTNGRAVERNIRTVGKVLWEQNRPGVPSLTNRAMRSCWRCSPTACWCSRRPRRPVPWREGGDVGVVSHRNPGPLRTVLRGPGGMQQISFLIGRRRSS